MVAYMRTRMNLNSQPEASSHADQPDFKSIERDKRVYMLTDKLIERYGKKDSRRIKEFEDIRSFMRSCYENKMNADDYNIFMDYLKEKELDPEIKHRIQQNAIRTYKQR